jgi:hypothetical protein
VIWFLRMFPAFRNLEARQAGLLDDAAGALTSAQSAHERCGELTHQLEIERAKRIAAETVAAERGSQITFLRESLDKVETSRDEAISERLKSLDLVNSALLRPLAPEAAPDLGQYKAIPKLKRQAVAEMRLDNQRFMTAMRDGKMSEYVATLGRPMPSAAQPPVEAQG